MFTTAKPSIDFVPVQGSPSDGRAYYVDLPLQIVNQYSCERTILFYSNTADALGMNISDTRLAGSLKFDEYKYAMAGVPFTRKWSLTVNRDVEREQRLFDSLKIDEPFVCIHDETFQARFPVPIPPEVAKEFRIIRVSPKTDSIFDWLLTLERASQLILVDSCFAHLVDQLKLPVKKTLVVRNTFWSTAVYRSEWRFVFPDPRDYVSNSSAYV
jgi:hypothetical protein